MATKTRILPQGRADTQDVERQDSPEAAEARVWLKLAAEGYSATRFGSDAGGPLTIAATLTLQARALAYYGRLTQRRLVDDLPENLQPLHDDLAVGRRFADLLVAALAYSGTRTGADACSEYTRSAIGALCATAIAYVEELLRASLAQKARPRQTMAGLPGGDEV